MKVHLSIALVASACFSSLAFGQTQKTQGIVVNLASNPNCSQGTDGNGNTTYYCINASVSWPSPFSDSNYAVSCTTESGPGTWIPISISNKTTSGFLIQIPAQPVPLGLADCIGVHN